jgi:hypothetical protein
MDEEKSQQKKTSSSAHSLSTINKSFDLFIRNPNHKLDKNQ